MATRTAGVRKDLTLGSVLGPVADAYRILPVDRRDAYLAARVRMVHIVPGGMCFHDFSQEPCPNYVQCTDGCGSFHHLKSDQLARKELETQRDALREQIKLAKQAILQGTFGAGPWFDLQERKYAEVMKILGESGEDGSKNDAKQEEQDPK